MSKSVKRKLARCIKQQRSADSRTGPYLPAARPSFKQGTTASSSTQVAAVTTPVSKGSSSASEVRTFTMTS